MIWFMLLMTMITLGAFLGYLKFAKTEEALYKTIDFGIRCAYVGLKFFLVLGGLVFLGIVGWWLVG